MARPAPNEQMALDEGVARPAPEGQRASPAAGDGMPRPGEEMQRPAEPGEEVPRPAAPDEGIPRPAAPGEGVPRPTPEEVVAQPVPGLGMAQPKADAGTVRPMPSAGMAQLAPEVGMPQLAPGAGMARPVPGERLAALAAELGPRVRRDEPLALYTTFRIGGPADLFYRAESADCLARAVLAARAHGVPYFLLGLGANILVGDRGFRGLVIHNRARRMEVLPEPGLLRAESGAVVWPDLIELAVASGLSGLEHYPGIPSTVGGAIWQNLHFLSPAPARERTMFIAEVTDGAEILTTEGERREVDGGYFQFGYDWSVLHERPDVVLTVTFRLAPGDPEEMRRIVRENLAWRAERHPPLATEPSAGSIFKKIEGVGAGRLIDQCGLKGTVIGGAVVSPRHANILVNRGGATAADVRALIAHVQQVVRERTGQSLEPEISFVGEF